MFNILFLLGAYALIFIAITSINNLRDGLKMTLLASIVRKAINNKGRWQNIRLGATTMLMEGDTMRAASALIGFANGRVIDQAQTAQALVASAAFKFVWVWIASMLAIFAAYVEMGWIALVLLGVLFVVSNVSNWIQTIGNILIYVGLLILGLIFSMSSVTNIGATSFPLWNYTVVSDAVGVVISGFIGVLIGTVLSGNFLSFFIVLPFVTYGFVGVESATSFVVGADLGSLFPMSMMVSETTLQSRRSFLFFSIIISITWIVDIFLLSFFDFSFLSSLGIFGFAISYTVLFSIMLILVYYISGMKLWSRVSGVAKNDNVDSKRHLHRFMQAYAPHVSILMLQAEREIVNLQFRIYKMLDFTIDVIDDEDAAASLEHIRKYRDIVKRTANEITDFIVTQTSMKNNIHVSEFAMERLQAVDLQCQIGNLFCDMAEAISLLDKSKYPIVRRCVVSLETLYNQATKLINSRFKSHCAEGSVLVEDVEELSNQLTELLKEFGGDQTCDVLPYTIVRSRKIIMDIIDNLK